MKTQKLLKRTQRNYELKKEKRKWQNNNTQKLKAHIYFKEIMTQNFPIL